MWHTAAAVITVILVIMTLWWNRDKHQGVVRHADSSRTRSRAGSRDRVTVNELNRQVAEELSARLRLSPTRSANRVASMLDTAQRTPLYPELAVAIQGDDIALNAMVEMLGSQQRESTLKQYIPAWEKWVEFAQKHERLIFPPAERTGLEYRDFTAGFDKFALHHYTLCNQRTYKSGRKKPLAPKAFVRTFSAINHVLVNVFNVKRIETSLVNRLTQAYHLRYPHRTVKARPMLGTQLVKLVRVARATGQPWLELVANVAIVAWMSTGRWSDLKNVLIRKSLDHVCPVMGHSVDPNDQYWHMYMHERKNVNGECVAECARLHGAGSEFDALTSFRSVVTKYNRVGCQDYDNEQTRHSWIPHCSKVQGKKLWVVSTDPSRYCGYNTFLQMLREALRIAGLHDKFDLTEREKSEGLATQEWSVHAFRMGFVTSVRNLGQELSLNVETVARQGGWNVNSVPTIMGYNNGDSTEHAKAVRPAIIASLFNK